MLKMQEPVGEHCFRHTSQFSPQTGPTEADLEALARSPIIEQIFTSRGTDLGDAIMLGRSTLGILISDRSKRFVAHQSVAEQLSLTPPINGVGERNIRPKHVLRLSREFFTGLARLDPPIDAGLEIGHQEHLGGLSEADTSSIKSLHKKAEEAVKESGYTVDIRDATSRLAPHITLKPFNTDDGATDVEVLSIHKKTPLFDVTPDPKLLPNVHQIDLYARRTYAGLSMPGRAMDRRAVSEYLTAKSPTEIVTLDGHGQLVPLSTSVILRARSHLIDGNI